MPRKSRTRRNRQVRPKNSIASLLKKGDRPFGGFSTRTLLMKEDRICLPFLAGKCVFTDERCMQCHPTEEEKDHLIATYKSVQCRFGDNCYTENCLYLHPYEMKQQLATIDDFPPLNGVSTPPPSTNKKDSAAWKNNLATSKITATVTPFPSPAASDAGSEQSIPTKESSVCTFMWGSKDDMDYHTAVSNIIIDCSDTARTIAF